MRDHMHKQCHIVNCRIGSLETNASKLGMADFVNCRIGSLENLLDDPGKVFIVNCLIGRLEISALPAAQPN